MTAPFHLELYMSEGRPLADLAASEGGPALLRERITWLRVRSDASEYVASTQAPADDDVTGHVPPVFSSDGLAVLVTTGHDWDEGGATIGMCHDGVGASELDQLRGALESIEWSMLPRPIGGDATTPQVDLRYSRGDLLIERRFNLRCAEFIQAIQPTWELLRALRRSLSRRPARALGVGVRVEREGERSAKCVLRFELENRGTGPVVLTDPRVPPTGKGARVLFRVGALMRERHDLPPLEWTVLPVPPLAEGARRSLVLDPRQRLELSLPWTAAKPGKYLLQGKWRDQDGVIEAVAGQLPFMPLSERGPSALGPGPYPIRGSAFAQLRFEAVGEDTQK